MVDSPVFTPDNRFAYLGALSSVITLNTGNPASLPARQPTTPVVADYETINGTSVAYWGDNNIYPQEVIRKARASTLVAPVLDWKTRAVYGGGLETGYYRTNLDGQKEWVCQEYPDWERFTRRTNVNRYVFEALRDLFWFYNPFPELVLSRDRRTIAGITAQDASQCRWELQNETTGRIANCYINANWERGWASDRSEFTAKVPALDPYMGIDGIAEQLTQGAGYKYIYPLSYPSPGKTYYQLADWHGAIESGWLEVAAAIPVFKRQLLKNQLSIKYHIEIADWYWEFIKPEWNTLSMQERNDIVATEMRKFTDVMTDVQNAGKALTTIMRSDPNTRQPYSSWKITPIDNGATPDGLYIEDSQEASSHLLFALGVDATLIGSLPGKGLGAGSGSDKREALNMYLSMCQFHTDLVFEPLYLIRDYNRFDPAMRFRLVQPFLQTLNQVSPASRNTTLPAAS